DSAPPPLSNPHLDHIHNLCKQCGITDENTFTLEQISSFVGMVDIEIVEAAIKKSNGKSMKYVLGTLNGMVNRDGITKKEHLLPKVGERDETHQPDRSGSDQAENPKPQKSGWIRTAGNAELQDRLRAVQ